MASESSVISQTPFEKLEEIEVPTSSHLIEPEVAEAKSQSPDVPHRRGHKRRYTDDQNEALDHSFAKKKWIEGEARKKLSESIGLSEAQISRWFENKRHKEKKAAAKEEGSSTETLLKDANPSDLLKNFTHSQGPITTDLVFEMFRQIDDATGGRGVLQEMDPLDVAALPPFQQLGQAILLHLLYCYQAQHSSSQNPTAPATTQEAEQVPTSPSAAPKPKRRKFTADQLQILQEAFAENQHPAPEKRLDLAVKLGLSRGQISKWFQNRRHIQRAESEKAEKEKLQVEVKTEI
ncbi:hypothetical protein QR680_018745 [Steinernema hermaphroditum]|uniref:Homeobox domain-containing protein n=1 Tax=Steinernema hermaphroditum TaxID=289476 RepID=A0AA39HIW2_9BILA|nr:hypothetical protein QR680_018745 [Steinernema hermaphroditum]